MKSAEMAARMQRLAAMGLVGAASVCASLATAEFLRPRFSPDSDFVDFGELTPGERITQVT